jgi:hypothetical protein
VLLWAAGRVLIAVGVHVGGGHVYEHELCWNAQLDADCRYCCETAQLYELPYFRLHG